MAACRLPELDVVLINRREVEGRRHFDLAHELFHILTWDAMPPEHSEAMAAAIPGARIEILDPAAHLASVERADAVTALIAGHLDGAATGARV